MQYKIHTVKRHEITLSKLSLMEAAILIQVARRFPDSSMKHVVGHVNSKGIHEDEFFEVTIEDVAVALKELETNLTQALSDIY